MSVFLPICVESEVRAGHSLACANPRVCIFKRAIRLYVRTSICNVYLLKCMYISVTVIYVQCTLYMHIYCHERSIQMRIIQNTYGIMCNNYLKIDALLLY